MKIGEACRSAGLTERTIRFYVERGLLHPESRENNGRVYFDFNDRDIGQLHKVSVLRKAGFSLDDIAEMERDAGRIGALVSGHVESMRAKEKEYADILKALRRTEGRQFTSSAELADALTQGVRDMKLPRADLQPDFARFDSETREQREAGYADFLVRQRIREKAAVLFKPLKIAAVALCAVGAALLLTYAISCIPRPIDRTYDGADFRAGEDGAAVPVHIHVQGRLYRRLFQEPIFQGKIELDSVPASRELDANLYFYQGFAYPAWLVYQGIRVENGESMPVSDSYAMAWTNNRFDYLVLNLFDKVGDGGELKDRVICAPAASIEEGMRLLRENDILGRIGGQ